MERIGHYRIMEKDYIELDLRTILWLIKKNILLIIILTMIGSVSAFLISEILIRPQFEASVMLAVNTRDEAAVAIANDQLMAARQLVNTYAVVLTNDTLLDEIIIELNLNDTVQTLQQRITAEPVNQTQVMRMTMRDNNPHIAGSVLTIIVEQAEELLVTTIRAGSVEIVSPVRINFEPVSPRIMLNTALGAVAGLIISLLIIFIRKLYSNTFITEDDVRRELNLPVIGILPSLSRKG